MITTVKLGKKDRKNPKKKQKKIKETVEKWCLSWNGLVIPINYRKDDLYFIESLEKAPQYCRIVRKIVKGKISYSIHRIKFITTEESYTSKASFLDNDELPVFDAENKVKHTFSGKRISRGLYKTKTGKLINADVNGALNILRKVNITVKNLNPSIFNPERVFVLRDKKQLGNKIKQVKRNFTISNEVSTQISVKIERPKKQFNINKLKYQI